MRYQLKTGNIGNTWHVVFAGSQQETHQTSHFT